MQFYSILITVYNLKDSTKYGNNIIKYHYYLCEHKLYFMHF